VFIYDYWAVRWYADCPVMMLMCLPSILLPIQTLNWTAAEKGTTLFYVNATNGCGASSIACFVVAPFCQLCKFRV